MSMTLSPRALQLILDHEVGGGRPYYEAFLQRPTWPSGRSGVTIGVGYDLGYTTEPRFRGDWPMLGDDVRDRLANVVGLKGAEAKSRVSRLRDIAIPWESALIVFQRRTIGRYIAETLQAFPGAEQLPADAFGALVSLVFNRGPSLSGRNRKDMEDIHVILRDGVQTGDLAKIAREIREMKVIWAGTGQPGLIRRREAEAVLVESAVVPSKRF